MGIPITFAFPQRDSAPLGHTAPSELAWDGGDDAVEKRAVEAMCLRCPVAASSGSRRRGAVRWNKAFDARSLGETRPLHLSDLMG